MVISNQERLAKALDILQLGLTPFVERELRSRLGKDWLTIVSREANITPERDGTVHWDVAALFKAMIGKWQDVFRNTLGHAERSYVGELLEVRNSFAHQRKVFTSDDTERALDTMKRLLSAVSAPVQAEEIQKMKIDLQRTIFDEQARNKTRYQLPLEGMPSQNLKPWREVVTPHPDIQSGRYAQAEFAADLAQVHRGEGSDEYKDPGEFFRRTYITTGLKDLLTGALERLTKKGGEPVIELQTNFGGGKTHSMLALYHLFGGTSAKTLAGVEELLKAAGVASAPKAHRAVLVGTDLSPAEPHKKPDGTIVRTMWGELAWQLGKKEGFALVADSDAKGVSPGANVFAKLFKEYSPSLILIDEWVAYARQLVGKGDLPGGTFESQASFAQSLTEAAKRVDGTLVVASIPSSKIEIGGDNGDHALSTLKNIFERVSKAWRPAGRDEGFEIVRRRLFEPLSGKDAFAHRDAVVEAFSRMYKAGGLEFPNGCSETAYRNEMVAAYPVHPELFHRLYDDWSTLDKFQRTRGVLRLLAKVIHRLWEGNDRGLLVMPAFIPMDDPQVKSELTRYLEDHWEPIISQDVDGDGSLPLEIDSSTPNLGRVSAARRVARTLYVGTAPGSDGKNPGIDDRQVRLGCVQPGETAAVFGDALRRLSDRAKFVHQDGSRYWISTKANLNRIAEDRAAAKLKEPEVLHVEVVRRLRDEQRYRGLFAGVHIAPESPSDVPDEPTARLVILGPKHGHRKGQADTDALKFAAEILASRGSGPRLERNCVAFLAADKKELEALLDATAHYLAWKSIADEWESLNLDSFRKKLAESKDKEFEKTVSIRIASAWNVAIVPAQDAPTDDVRWDDFKLAGTDHLAVRAGAKLKSEEALFPEFGAARLRMVLDKHLWTDHDHVSFGQLSEWFARYLYLPRLTSADVLRAALLDGVNRLHIDDTFATAALFDGGKKRYVDLRAGNHMGQPVIDRGTLVIKPEVAGRQREEPTSTVVAEAPTPSFGSAGVGLSHASGTGSTAPQKSRAPNAYVGSVELNPSRVGRDAGRIAEEVIQHLSTLPGADVRVTLEIHAKVDDDVPESTVRTVSENARTLKFSSSNFERE